MAKQTKTAEAKEQAPATPETKPATPAATAPPVKAPTVGRIVHYFPNELDKEAQSNGATFLPGIVVKVEGMAATLRVFQDSAEAPLLRRDVAHKDAAAQDRSYWNWIETK